MKISNSQKIGLFVIIILVGLFFALNFLKGHDLFKKSNRYYTYLPSVEGMVATSPIYIRGLKVGSIEKIKLDKERAYEYFREKNFTDDASIIILFFTDATSCSLAL